MVLFKEKPQNGWHANATALWERALSFMLCFCFYFLVTQGPLGHRDSPGLYTSLCALGSALFSVPQARTVAAFVSTFHRVSFSFLGGCTFSFLLLPPSLYLFLLQYSELENTWARVCPWLLIEEEIDPAWRSVGHTEGKVCLRSCLFTSMKKIYVYFYWLRREREREKH